MMKIFRKYGVYIGSFLVPALLLVLVYAVRRVFPFGEESVLALDLNGQYIYYYEAFRDAFLSGKSLFYSFSRTLGGEMAGLYAYYLASPFSLVLLLFPKTFITEAVLLVILLKVSCAGLAFAVYLKASRRAANAPTLMFSVMYALMSYMVVQTLNPMWLDGLVLLPLIILFTERFADSAQFAGLASTLALLFISNFYIGYMTGILVFVYFVFYLSFVSTLAKLRDKAIRLISFLGVAFLAAGASLWLILPTLYSLSMGKLTFTDPSFIPLRKLDVFDVMSKMLPAVYDSVNYPGLPFVFAGTMVLLLMAFYFVSGRFSLKEKTRAASVIGLFLMLFSVSTFDLVLHGFQAPNWLNYRYSFVFSFWLLIMAYDAYERMQASDQGDLMKASFVVFLAVFLVGKLGYPHIVAETTLWLSYACLTIYTFLLIGIKGGRTPRALATVLIVLVCAEMFLNAMVMVDGAHAEVYYSDRPSYRDYFDRLYPAAEHISNSDESFYRSETVMRRTVNDPMALGLYGVSHSSSTLNARVIEMMHKLGFSSREHWTSYKGATPVTDSLLGMKYLISERKVNDLYVSDFAENGITVYRNPYALPLAFPVNETISSLILDSVDPFINQNLLLSTMLGREYTEYFKLVPVKDIVFENIHGDAIDDYVAYRPIDPALNAHIEYLLAPPQSRDMYMYLYAEHPRKANIWLEREYLDTFFGYDTVCILPLGSYENKDTLSVITTPIEADYYLNNNMFYYLDAPLFHSDISALAGASDVNKISETRLEITVSASPGDVLFTSIPYERGWTVTLDGRRVEPIEVLGSLMAIELTEGQHIVSMRFIPYGLITGLILSVASVLALALLHWRKKRGEKRESEACRNVENIQ